MTCMGVHQAFHRLKHIICLFSTSSALKADADFTIESIKSRRRRKIVEEGEEEEEEKEEL